MTSDYCMPQVLIYDSCSESRTSHAQIHYLLCGIANLAGVLVLLVALGTRIYYVQGERFNTFYVVATCIAFVCCCTCLILVNSLIIIQ